ncbi:MAG: phenylacetate--CoA ligase family protein [Candidatus Fimadaptatus sp.]|jgi:phenylacetate-CoA ligase
MPENMRIFDPAIETMPREEMRKLQLERLKSTVKQCYERVPMYRKRMDEMGVHPEDVRTLEDAAILPFTVKDDVRDNYPYGLLAVPMRDIVRLHASSGTTGKPITAGYTRADLDNWATMVARLCVAGGAGPDDIAQISFGYGLFTGALGLHYGLEKLGATVVPISSGNTERQIMLMRDFGTTVLIATPAYAMYMAETAERMGMVGELKLKYGILGAEGSTEEMRRELERRWGGITVTENYGLTEIMGPGVAGDCLYKDGMHINEDFFLCEIVDPKTNKPLPDGEYGELVITNLLKEGQPMLRYRTHDITRIIDAPCACGRTSRRIEKIRGRSDDMLIVRGVNLFPSQVEAALLGVKGIGPHYEIVLTRHNYMDKVQVKVELLDGSLLESYGALEELRREIQSNIRRICQLDMDITLVSPNTLKRFEGKARRVTDLRDKG